MIPNSQYKVKCTITTGTVVSACAISSSCFGFNSNEYFLNFKLTFNVPEWSSQTNAAIVACKEGPLKCANLYTATISNANVITGMNVPDWITSCTGTSNKTCTLANLGLTTEMSCSIQVIAGTANNPTNKVSTGTTSQISWFLVPNGDTSSVNVTCVKRHPDYNEAYERIVIQKDDADVRATEWLTGGFDYTSNKPIYRRCHVNNTNITSSGLLVNWPAGLIPRGHTKCVGLS